MSNLLTFRNRVRELCRRSSPYDDNRKAGLADLANAVGLSRGELSYRLNGTNKAKLTNLDARAIVRTLVDWGAIHTRAEVIELLALVDCPPLTAAAWEAPPFDQLLASASSLSPFTPPASVSISRSAKVERRVAEAVRPPTHQPESSRTAVGRAGELAALSSALAQHGCVAVTGGGGIGKSTFVAMYSKGGHYAPTCWRNLHHNPNFADFTSAALGSLGLYFDPATMPRPQDQANYIASVLRGNAEISQLLVLNNFESVIGEDGVAAGWHELLELAIAGLGNSRVLITTRDLPYTRHGREPYRFALGGLSVPDGIALLEALGISAGRAELEQAVRLAGGYPLALIFLADLSNNQGYPVADLLRETVWSERIAERFLDRIYHQLADRTKAVLSYLSIFSAPTDTATIVGMLAHLPVAGDDVAVQWREAQVRRSAEELANRSLLDQRGGYYQLHPIVREYAYNRLADQPRYHHAAATYLASHYIHDAVSNPPRRIADIQPLLDRFDHLCAAGDYEAACDVFTQPLEQMSAGYFASTFMLLNRWGDYMRTALMGQRLAESPPELLSDAKRCLALNGLGIAYRNLGQYDEAIACYQRGLALAKGLGDARKQAYFLSNIAVAYEGLQQYDQAIDYAQQVLAFAEPAGLLELQGTSWTSLGNIYTKLGDYARALTSHQRAATFAQAMNDQTGMVHDRLNLGEAYFNLGQPETAMQYYRSALQLAEQIGYLEGQGTMWHNVGQIQMQGGNNLAALACLLKALAIREPLGNADSVARTSDQITTLRTALPRADWRKLFTEAEQLAADPHWLP